MHAALRSPYGYGVGAVIVAGVGALSWVGFPSVANEHERAIWVMEWSAVFAVLAIVAFIALHRQKRELERRLEPRARVLFDDRDVNYVQPGKVVSGTTPCDEYKYAVGVVNVSERQVTGCRVVLEASNPHDTSKQRLGVPMRVRSDPNMESSGLFVLNPNNGRCGEYVELFRELVPQQLGLAEHARIQLINAHSAQGQANWFDRGEHLLTFRLEGDMAHSVPFQFLVKYDADRRRWTVALVTPSVTSA